MYYKFYKYNPRYYVLQLLQVIHPVVQVIQSITSITRYYSNNYSDRVRALQGVTTPRLIDIT